MKNLSQAVRDVLETEKEAKQNDSILLFATYEKFGFILNGEQKLLLRILPPPNSVLRIGSRERKAHKTKRQQP